MADPVKVTIMKKVEEAVRSLSAIKTVIRGDTTPIDRDTAVFPLSFIFDDKETGERRNRIKRKTFPLFIEVWVDEKSKTTNIGDILEVHKADLEQALIKDRMVDFYGVTVDINEEDSEKFFVDEFCAAILIHYTVAYHHAAGNAYDPAKGT
jgi:hypothetical protein